MYNIFIIAHFGFYRDVLYSYSNVEKTDMLACYIESRKNKRSAARYLNKAIFLKFYQMTRTLT